MAANSGVKEKGKTYTIVVCFELTSVACGFKESVLEKLEGKLGDSQGGQERRGLAEEKAGRIVREELGRFRKKLAIAARLCLGTSKSANVRLHNATKTDRREEKA